MLFAGVLTDYDSMNLLAELLQMYRDKDYIFNNAAALLSICCRDPKRSAVLKGNTSAMTRLEGVARLLQVVMCRCGVAARALTRGSCSARLVLRPAHPKPRQLKLNWLL
jgi:hypothetical protein